MDEGVDYSQQAFSGLAIKMRELEEKQRIIKDRMLLVGQNLIETKEKTTQDILDIKRDIEILKLSVERLLSFLESASEEFSKFAKKEDLEILSKQAKMFQPLKFEKSTKQ